MQKTLYECGDVVMIKREAKPDRYYDTEDGRRIWVPKEMLDGALGTEREIFCAIVEEDTGRIVYTLADDDSRANDEYGWFWPSSLFAYRVTEQRHLIEDTDLLEIL